MTATQTQGSKAPAKKRRPAKKHEKLTWPIIAGLMATGSTIAFGVWDRWTARDQAAPKHSGATPVPAQSATAPPAPVPPAVATASTSAGAIGGAANPVLPVQINVPARVGYDRATGTYSVQPVKTCPNGETVAEVQPCPPPVPPPVPVPPPPSPVPTPPPPENGPPPPPPPCVAGPFMVFFDWDKDGVAPQAAAILDNAASAYQTCGQAQVIIAGHADRSGSDRYNVGLSQRRTAKVRSYLAGRGIPDGVMSTEAFGESRPLVETADGIREPQNRRVEITFGPGSGW